MSKKYWCSICKWKPEENVWMVFTTSCMQVICVGCCVKYLSTQHTEDNQPITCPVSPCTRLIWNVPQVTLNADSYTVERKVRPPVTPKTALKVSFLNAVSDFWEFDRYIVLSQALGLTTSRLFYLQSTKSVVINFGILCGALFIEKLYYQLTWEGPDLMRYPMVSCQNCSFKTPSNEFMFISSVCHHTLCFECAIFNKGDFPEECPFCQKETVRNVAFPTDSEGILNIPKISLFLEGIPKENSPDQETDIESEQCLTCLSNKAVMIGFRCGHKTLCIACAKRLEQSNNLKGCPQCSQILEKMLFAET